MDEAAARQRLEQLLSELDESTATLSAENGDTGELSRVDQHPAEAASELAAQEGDDAVLTVVSGQRQQVLDALARLDAGTYGRCVECGSELSPERLDARPEAARCMSCQQELEMSR